MKGQYFSMNPHLYPHGRGGGMGGRGRGNGMGGRGRGEGMGRHQNDLTSDDSLRGTGAQTFRRGRILSFLDRLIVKKETLENQLKQEQYQELKPILSGELKAVESIINEFVQEFDLVEYYGAGGDE